MPHLLHVVVISTQTHTNELFPQENLTSELPAEETRSAPNRHYPTLSARQVSVSAETLAHFASLWGNFRLSIPAQIVLMDQEIMGIFPSE